MRDIHRLPPGVVNKIAAGEVIERPASVAKELIENSIDSGATRIDVSVGTGGTEYIRVTDNGCGIAADQLPLAVAQHATSKIADADDLFRVDTLGFRGEALASIAEISQVVLKSRLADQAEGAKIEVVGGTATETTPCGAPAGTSIEVKNLFFNTPVRRKFLRSTQTEMSHVSEAFARIALAHPSVHFTLRHNERSVHELPPADPWTERIARMFGAELAENLIWIESEDQAVHLSGYVAHPSQSRGNQRMQYLFLNGRHIRDRALQHALREAYRGLLTTGRFPICLLRLQMPPEMVDVNVHPAKLEVRLLDGGRLYSQVLGTIRTRFLSADMSTRIQTNRVGDHSADLESGRQQLVSWAKDALGDTNAHSQSSQGTLSNAPQPHLVWNNAADAPDGLSLSRLARPWEPATAMRGGLETADVSPLSRDLANSPSAEFAPNDGNSSPMPVRDYAGVVPAMQIHNRYLIAESPEGVIVIDQHALHERILYEQLRDKVLSGALETQSLLVPEPVDLGPAEAGCVRENQELLGQLGLTVEPFGGDTVLISSYPAMLANMKPAEVLRDVVDQLTSGEKIPERRDLLDSLLHMIACKAAIKAGDRLSPSEITALLTQREQVRETHHCPHGRPSELIFTREELDRQFKRT